MSLLIGLVIAIVVVIHIVIVIVMVGVVVIMVGVVVIVSFIITMIGAITVIISLSLYLYQYHDVCIVVNVVNDIVDVVIVDHCHLDYQHHYPYR